MSQLAEGPQEWSPLEIELLRKQPFQNLWALLPGLAVSATIDYQSALRSTDLSGRQKVGAVLVMAALTVAGSTWVISTGPYWWRWLILEALLAGAIKWLVLKFGFRSSAGWLAYFCLSLSVFLFALYRVMLVPSFRV